MNKGWGDSMAFIYVLGSRRVGARGREGGLFQRSEVMFSTDVSSSGAH